MNFSTFLGGFCHLWGVLHLTVWRLNVKNGRICRVFIAFPSFTRGSTVTNLKPSRSLSLPRVGKAAERPNLRGLQCSCFQKFDASPGRLINHMLEAVCGKTPKDYESNAEAGRYRNMCGSVLRSQPKWGCVTWFEIPSGRERKLPPNIIMYRDQVCRQHFNENCCYWCSLFYFIFFYWCWHICDYEKKNYIKDNGYL